MSEPFFITTAIDYTNGAPHIGHAYEKVLADVLARYHRLKGDDVFFLTGVDQHGQKVQQSAEREGVPPQQFVDGITAKFVALWDKLEVLYGRHAEIGSDLDAGWAATTDRKHKECVRANLQMLWDDKVPGTDRSRWLYKKTQRGFYSVRQEQFLTDKERGPDGEFGPEWQPVEEREEENFYFRLTEHPDLGFDPKQWLLDLIRARHAAAEEDAETRGDGDAEGADSPRPRVSASPRLATPPRPLVLPDFRVAELRNAVEKLEGDLCISRPASRLQWGIPFPESFGAGFVTYVWFDALVNYITFAPGHDPGYSERQERDAATRGHGDAESADSPRPRVSASPGRFADWWPPLHVIGKDILIPAHGIYWPIMLKALGFTDDEMPTLLVHGWWNIRTKGGESEKMSKSLGNVVDPDVLADKYGVEALRYYLMSDIATGRDADFSEERLIQRYNTDLANSLGNLLNRSLSMAGKYREGVINRTAATKANAPMGNKMISVQDIRAISFDLNATLYSSAFEKPDPQSAVNAALELVNGCNRSIDASKPWALAKDPAQAEFLDAVLYDLADSLRIIAILLSPVLPRAAHGIFDQLNWKMAESGRFQRFHLDHAVWAHPEHGLPDGHVLGQPTPLFPRIEIKPPEAA